MPPANIKSMTGFGAARAQSGIGQLAVELKSINSRFPEVRANLPPSLAALEPQLRGLLKSEIARGKLECRVDFIPAPGAAGARRLNQPVILEYLEEIGRLESKAPSAIQVSLEGILKLPGALLEGDTAPDAAPFWPHLESCARAALAAFHSERAREGAALAEQMRADLASVDASRAKILAARGPILERAKEKLRARLAELESETKGKLEPGRIELEVALLADRSDVSEELVRLGAHLARFAQILDEGADGGAGRALDFLLQEILREVNTTSAKLRDLEALGETLAMKSAVERLREQIQNVE